MRTSLSHCTCSSASCAPLRPSFGPLIPLRLLMSSCECWNRDHTHACGTLETARLAAASLHGCRRCCAGVANSMASSRNGAPALCCTECASHCWRMFTDRIKVSGQMTLEPCVGESGGHEGRFISKSLTEHSATANYLQKTDLALGH